MGNPSKAVMYLRISRALKTRLSNYAASLGIVESAAAAVLLDRALTIEERQNENLSDLAFRARAEDSGSA